MSVNINCPNCGGVIGEASSEDNYVEKYYHKDDDGEPICIHCGSGTFSKINVFLFIIGLIGIGITLTLFVYFL